MLTINENQREALRLFSVYTAGHCDPYSLAGPRKASCRADIMSALNGKRTPQSQSGLTAMTQALHAILEPTGSCIAARENDFTRKLASAGFNVNPETLERSQLY